MTDCVGVGGFRTKIGRVLGQEFGLERMKERWTFFLYFSEPQKKKGRKPITFLNQFRFFATFLFKKSFFFLLFLKNCIKGFQLLQQKSKSIPGQEELLLNKLTREREEEGSLTTTTTRHVVNKVNRSSRTFLFLFDIHIIYIDTLSFSLSLFPYFSFFLSSLQTKEGRKRWKMIRQEGRKWNDWYSGLHSFIPLFLSLTLSFRGK